MSKALYLRKISSFLLALTLVVVPFCSFADDESAADPVQGSAPLSFTLEEWEFISQASDDEDRQLRQSAVLASTATTYDLDDIYSILSSVRMIDNSRYVWATYDESVWSEIHNVYNKLITNTYDNAGTWYSISELVAQFLKNFNAFSSGFYSPLEGAPDFYHLVDDIKTFTGLGLFDSQANPYLDLINSRIGSLTSSMTSGFNAVLTRQGQLLSSVDSLRSDVQGTTSAVNITTNSVNNVVSSVDTLKSDFNNVSWIPLSSFDPSSVSCFDSQGNSLSFPSSYTGSDLYISFLIPITDLHCAYFIQLPFYLNDFRNYSDVLEFGYISSSGVFYPIDNTSFAWSYDNTRYYTNIYLTSLYSTFYLRPLTVHVKVSGHTCMLSSSIPRCFYIDSSSVDYYTVSQFIHDHDIDMILNRFKILYASDDLIQAKQNQQGLEDQVLDDFTGSGSASASLGDALDVKGIQSELKDSLSVSGASASGLSTILDSRNASSSDSFFYFFSRDCYNDINGVNNIPQTRDTFIFLDDRDELNRLLGGQSW